MSFTLRNQDERIGVGRDDVRLGPETNEFERCGDPADFDFFFDEYDDRSSRACSSLENGQRLIDCHPVFAGNPEAVRSSGFCSINGDGLIADFQPRLDRGHIFGQSVDGEVAFRFDPNDTVFLTSRNYGLDFDDFLLSIRSMAKVTSLLPSSVMPLPVTMRL